MNVDHFFKIGNTHKVCQDYALSGQLDNCWYGMVSDGCSSSKDTDFGSRLLCKSALNVIKDDITENTLKKLWSNAKECLQIKTLNLQPECLDATLLLMIGNSEKINVVVTGDGNIVTKKNNGEITLIKINYVGNAPVYMNYWYYPERMSKLFNTYDCKKKIETITIMTDRTTKSEIIDSDQLYEFFQFNTLDYQFVSVVTDGLQSFQQLKDHTTSLIKHPLADVDIIMNHGLYDYKNWQGQFVERRMIKFIKDCEFQEISHYDDLAISTLFIK